MENLYYIQTPFDTQPCNLKLNKKYLSMEVDDVLYKIIQKLFTTNVENAGLELITSEYNND